MKLIVYDFDGTIYDGDSTIDFLKYLIKKKKWLIIYFPRFIFSFIIYKFKLIKKEKLKENFFSIFKHFNINNSLLDDFWSINKEKIKTFFKNKKNHNNDIIATASPQFLIEPIAKKYKIKNIFGSIVDSKTGKYTGLNCHGNEKIIRINEIYPDSIINEMYSDDAIADKPLLELAKKSYIVEKNSIKIYESQKYKTSIINKLYKKYDELIKYLFIGGVTVLISLVIYYICVLTFLNPYKAIELQIANIISWIISVIFAYFANRIVVFNSINPNKIKESISFFITRLITLLLDMFIMFLFVSIFSVNDKLSKLISQVIVIVVNYIISKFFVFRK